MSKWISVEERLPKDGESVIGYDVFYERVGEVAMASWCKHLIFVDSQRDDCKVTHWMSFPRPPREEKGQ